MFFWKGVYSTKQCPSRLHLWKVCIQYVKLHWNGAKFWLTWKTLEQKMGGKIILQFETLHIYPTVSFSSCRSWDTGDVSEGEGSPRGISGVLWACLLLRPQSVSTSGVYEKFMAKVRLSTTAILYNRYVFICKR